MALVEVRAGIEPTYTDWQSAAAVLGTARGMCDMRDSLCGVVHPAAHKPRT
jgi:hypothetical protein